MTTPIENAVATAAWCDKHVKPLLASLASQGHVDPAKAMQLLDGLDVMVATVKVVAKHVDLMRAVVGQPEAARTALAHLLPKV